MPASSTGTIASLEAPGYCRADRFLAWAAALDEATPHAPPLRRADADVLAPERRDAEQLAAQAPLLLQLGCDASIADGRIEVRSADGQRADLRWDLSQPLPLPPGSVDSIFHEHLLDRFSYAQGIELHRRCLAVLRPGGVLRIRVADAGAALQDYAANVGGDAEEWPMAMARVACLTADPARRSLYDAETLELSCLAAGFPRADQLDFAECDEPCLYVEGDRLTTTSEAVTLPSS